MPAPSSRLDLAPVEWARWRPLWLFLAAFFLLAAGSRGTITTIDTQVRYLVSQRLWEDGSVHPLAEALEATGGFFATGKDGHWVSPYGLGQSVLMLPAVAAADLAARLAPEPHREEIRTLGGPLIYKVLLLPLWGALALLAIFRLGCRLGLEPRVSIWTAFAAAFGTYWWYYAKTVGHGLEVTTLLLWGLALWRPDGGVGRSIACGALLGATLLYRMEFIIPVGMITLICTGITMREHGEFGSVVALVVPMILFGLAVLWHNHERTGHILDAGYRGALAAADHRMFARVPAQHLLAITVGWNRGFLWYSPLLFAFALVPFTGQWRIPRGVGWGCIVLFVFVLFVASVDLAPQVSGWGQRFLLPITPFVILGLGVLFAPALRTRQWRRILATIVMANVALQGVLTFHEHGEVQRQTARVVEQATDEEHIEAAPRGWRRSDWAATLRNIGVPLGDPAAVVAAWSRPEVQAIRTGPEENLWWWKLANRLDSPTGSKVLIALGIALAITGGVFLFLALRAPSVVLPGADPTASSWLPGRRRVTVGAIEA